MLALPGAGRPSGRRPRHAGDGAGRGGLTAPSRYADLLPDEPRWLDTRGILLCWPSTVLEDEGHEPGRPSFVVVSEVEPIAAVVGRPGADTVKRAVESLSRAARDAPEGSEVEILCQPEAAEALAPALPGWLAQGATLHRLPGNRAAPDRSRRPADEDASIEIALVHPDARHRVERGEVPGRIYQELDLTWRRGRPVAIAFAAGADGIARPAAFLSAALETEGWWDVSVETLPEHRRRGLAAGCFRGLHAYYRELGKRAVWGAHDDNPASLRLAARLGFEADCRLATFRSPG